ncbi:hypothetical protein BBJ28_00004028 [Nothophytophthora sp. Chile5]|nr:hypothetical protein BBJ28_00004028 [Nothophytophthora sp. Chile5]
MFAEVALSSAIALLALASHADAHGHLYEPEPTFMDGKPTVEWVVQIDNYWDGVGSGGDQVGIFKTMAEEKGVTVRDVVLEMVGDATCGYTRTDVDPKEVPTDGKAIWWGNGGGGFTHQGPCEIWIDDTMVLHGDNCENEYPGGADDSGIMSEMPVDYSSCNGDCTLAIYWLGFQNEQWQAYINCVPLTGGSGSSTTTTEAPATETPATETSATEAPDTETPATEAPQTEAPATEAPATEAPATEAPATEVSETEAPETEAEAETTEVPSTSCHFARLFAVAVLAFASLVDAHGHLYEPEPTFMDGKSTVEWVAQIDYYWEEVGSGGDQVGIFKTMAEEKNMTVRDVLLEMAPDYPCGYTVTDGDPKEVPTDGLAIWLGNDGGGFTHVGPCEIWLDDTMVLHSDNCEEDYPGGANDSGIMSEMPVDYTSCNGDCLLAIYWLGFQNEQWQAYSNSETSVAGDTSETEAPATGVSATETPATEAPATTAPATEAPATETPATEAPATEAPATEAATTDAPAAEADATEAPTTSCNRRRH